MIKRIYIYVPGILNLPGSTEGWTDRAVTWTHTRTPYRAEKFEYWNGPLGAMATANKRAAALIRMLKHYDPERWQIVLVGHSHGCEVIVRALRGFETPIHAVFLMAPSCSEELSETGLLERLGSNNIYKLVIGIGGRDRLLRAAKKFSPLLKLFGIRYGHIGGDNPETVMNQLNHKRGRVAYMPTFNHNDWVRHGINFELTMLGIQRETL